MRIDKGINVIRVSAPGKLMLFGEHSVVYNRPCIVTAVDHRMSVSMEKRGDDKIIIVAKDVGMDRYETCTSDLNKEHPKEVRFVLKALKNFFKEHSKKTGLNIETKSDFSSLFGFGSSSAVTVCTIKALDEIFSTGLSKKEIFELCYKTVLDVQGVGSGFDVAAATYGGTLYFVRGGKVIEPLNVKELPLVVGYTGIKADTSTIVRAVREEMKKNEKKINNIFDEITKIVERAKQSLLTYDLDELGKLMNKNHDLLRKLGVSTKELENLTRAARSAGALGAKLSGAGGGDCMIALGNGKVGKSIEKAGGKLIPVKSNVKGVMVEG